MKSEVTVARSPDLIYVFDCLARDVNEQTLSVASDRVRDEGLDELADCLLWYRYKMGCTILDREPSWPGFDHSCRDGRPWFWFLSTKYLEGVVSHFIPAKTPLNGHRLVGDKRVIDYPDLSSALLDYYRASCSLKEKAGT